MDWNPGLATHYESRRGVIVAQKKAKKAAPKVCYGNVVSQSGDQLQLP
jgi:hypothetical protein